MNTHASRGTRKRAWLQACLIALLINLLVFPPVLPAQDAGTPVSLSWNGGTGNWSNLVPDWSCTNNCPSPGAYPNNGDGISDAYTYLASITTGADSVTLDNTQPAINIDGLTVGKGDGTGASSPPEFKK